MNDLISRSALHAMISLDTKHGTYGEFMDGSEVSYTSREVHAMINEAPAVDAEGGRLMETYAEVKWSWEDVQAVHPDWDEKRCRRWLQENEKWFRDTLIQYGNEMLSCAR